MIIWISVWILLLTRDHGGPVPEMDADLPFCPVFQNIRTDIVMDVGTSLNPAIDIGQVSEGVLLFPSCQSNHTALRIFCLLSLSRLYFCKHHLFNLAQNYVWKYSITIWRFLAWIIRLQDIVQSPSH